MRRLDRHARANGARRGSAGRLWPVGAAALAAGAGAILLFALPADLAPWLLTAVAAFAVSIAAARRVAGSPRRRTRRAGPEVPALRIVAPAPDGSGRAAAEIGQATRTEHPRR